MGYVRNVNMEETSRLCVVLTTVLLPSRISQVREKQRCPRRFSLYSLKKWVVSIVLCKSPGPIEDEKGPRSRRSAGPGPGCMQPSRTDSKNSQKPLQSYVSAHSFASWCFRLAVCRRAWSFSSSRVLLQSGNLDRKSTRLNSSHIQKSRMPSSA